MIDQQSGERALAISSGRVRMEGDLRVPAGAGGLVVFAHGSGSGRHSPRNLYVAASLRAAGLGTLLLDLLTREEEEADRLTGHLRFDIPLLAERLAAATRWVAEHGPRGLDIGYFGASTGAGAALIAAAADPHRVAAVVSRGGRPDLAGTAALSRVQAPTLLIVGGADTTVLALNREAYARLAAREKELTVITGASHLFEEPGALERVALLAQRWFTRHLGCAGRRATAREG